MAGDFHDIFRGIAARGGEPGGDNLIDDGAVIVNQFRKRGVAGDPFRTVRKAQQRGSYLSRRVARDADDTDATTPRRSGDGYDGFHGADAVGFWARETAVENHPGWPRGTAPGITAVSVTWYPSLRKA